MFADKTQIVEDIQNNLNEHCFIQLWLLRQNNCFQELNGGKMTTPDGWTTPGYYFH